MTTAALRHFVEHALGTYADNLTDWFPGCFHWAGLCADVPRMVAAAEGVDRPDDDPGGEAELEDRAERVFGHAYVTGLAVLSTAGGEDSDPEETLEFLTEFPDEGEEDYFEALVLEVLGPLEERLAGREVALDTRGDQALQLVEMSWSLVQPLLEEGGLRGEAAEDDPHAEAAQSVLLSVAFVAAILAALRWLSVGRVPTAAAGNKEG